MSNFPITFYHNPRCGTSRNALELVRSAGHEPEVIEYLQAGWTRPQLEKIVADSGVPARDLVRDKGTDAAVFGLLDPTTPETRIIDEMVRNPALVNRPIVVTPRGTRLCRPAERVLDLL